MKKHNLFKLIMITLFVVMLASWGLSITSVSNGEFVTQDANKIGLFNLLSYFIVAIQYFGNIAIFVLVIGGLYGVLYHIPQYRVLLDKIVAGFKNKEWLFMIIVGIFFAVSSSMAGFSLPLLILFPFVISVVLLMGYDKMTAVILTVGSTIAGLIGSLFSSADVYGLTAVFNSVGLKVAANDNPWFKVLLLVVSIVIVLVNTILYARKHKENEELKDSYLIPKKVNTTNKKVYPLVIVLDFMLVLLILAFISWDIFEIDVFQKITSAFVKPTGNGFAKGLFGAFNTVLGLSESTSFGNWTLTEATLVLLMGSALLAFMYRKSVSSYFSYFAEGAKRAIYPALLILLSYTVLVCVTNVPFELSLIKPLLSLNGEVSVITMCFVAIVFTLFTVEPYYGVTSAASYVLAVTSASNLAMVSLCWQSMYGLVMLVAPTSVILVATLSYMGINYGQWLKFAWKVFLELLVLIVLILMIV